MPLPQSPEHLQPCGQAQDAGRGRCGAGKGAGKTCRSSGFFLQKEQRGRGRSCAGGSPVAAKVWDSSFLWAHTATRPWLLRALAWRRRLSFPRSGAQDAGDKPGWWRPPAHQPRRRGGPSALSECLGSQEWLVQTLGG